MDVKFDRKPYTVRYTKDGEQQTYRRRPAKKLHDMLPKDQVRLTRAKNADFAVDDTYSVKHISPRQPNVIQIADEEGNSTFVDYYDLELNQRLSPRDGKEFFELEENQKYLLWP